MADCGEFLSFILDKLHEDLKDIYVPNMAKKSEKSGVDEWAETGEKNKKLTFNNHDLLSNIENSIIRDIFGGIIRNEFHVEGSRHSSITFDPCFVLSLDIPFEECSIEDCLDNYFQNEPVEGYQQNGRTVRAHQRHLFEKLPNILMVNLKRFVYTDRLIKKKEHVYFEDTLTIEDNHVSPQLQLGVFKKASEAGSKRTYRLFSVVEHIGQHANRGHYVCYTLDSSNDWVKFDDKRWSNKPLDDIKNDVQAYMLFYELIQD